VAEPRGSPFPGHLGEEKEGCRGERSEGGGGLREEPLVWSKFLQECQWKNCILLHCCQEMASQFVTF